MTGINCMYMVDVSCGERFLLILLKIPADGEGGTGYHDGSCCDRLEQRLAGQTADTQHLAG